MKCGHGGDRHRDVVLDRAAFRLLRRVTSRRAASRTPRAGCRLAAITASSTMPSSMPRARMASSVVARVVARRRQLHQHVPGMRLGKRIADVDAVAHAELDGDVGKQLETGEAAGGLVARDRQQLQRIVRRFQADERGLHRARFWKQFQRRRGDDAERAFGADEQVAQVVAGVVLLQLRQAVENAAVGQHDFEPERHVARHAVGQRGGAAGIGGEIAADGAAAFGAERQRKQPVGVGRALLRVLQDHAGLAGHGVGRGVEVANAVHPPHRDHHLAVVRRLPADEAGVAALRHQRDAVSRWRACRSRRLPRSSPGAAPAASGHETACAPR